MRRAQSALQIERAIPEISQKMLAQTLRGFERDDSVVTRTLFTVVPPRVDYELTAAGKTLVKPLAALQRWATENMGQAANLADRFPQYIVARG